MPWKYGFKDTLGNPTQRVRTCWMCAHDNRPSAIGAGEPFALRLGTFVDADGVEDTMTVSLHFQCSSLAAAAGGDDAEGASIAGGPESSAANQSPPPIPAPSAGSEAAAENATPPGLAAADLPPEISTKLANLGEIQRLNGELGSAIYDVEATKEHLKELKAIVKTKLDEMRRFIKEGPQMQLPFGSPAGVAAAPQEPEWRSRAVSLLAIPMALAELLIDAGYGTLGAVKDLWDAGKTLKEVVKGLGPAKELTISDAWADYGKEHPEIYGELPAGGEDAPANDVDPFAGDEAPGDGAAAAAATDDDPFAGDEDEAGDDDDADDERKDQP